jgi:methenyltetrahydrofolate cyclohydrolase
LNNSIWNWTLKEFRDRTASNSATPGGGAVAATSAALGLSLVIMALEITSRKKNPSSTSLDLAELLSSARENLELLSRCADDDMKVFQAYMEALALPKETELQKSARKKALAEALLKATDVPLSVARHVLRALDIAAASAKISSRNVLSDVGVGAALLGGAVKGILYNVDTNITGLDDAQTQARTATERRLLARESSDKVTKILEEVSARLIA